MGRFKRSLHTSSIEEQSSLGQGSPVLLVVGIEHNHPGGAIRLHEGEASHLFPRKVILQHLGIGLAVNGLPFLTVLRVDDVGSSTHEGEAKRKSSLYSAW